MLHLPYTSMVLSFAVVGAVISPQFSWGVLGATLGAYFAGLGVGAHFLDQLPGMGSRYVRHWSSGALWAVGIAGISVGMVIGLTGSFVLHEPLLLVFVVVQGLCAVGYPLAPLFRNLLHRDSVFALSWGSLPCLTSYYAQSGGVSPESVALAAVFAVVAVAEIRLSRRSRNLRRTDDVGAPDLARPIPPAVSLRTADTSLELLSVGTTAVALGWLAARVFQIG